ncbi:MAG: ATP-dependent RecD-like DNA helicase [Sphingomonadales bacterium]
MPDNLQFTHDQQQAFAQFLDFLRTSGQRKLWVLTGYAGTGKSTLVAHIVQQMQQEKLGFKLLAPTGRAAKVLSNYAGFPASTIHRHIYFSGGELSTQQLTLAKNLHKNTLFFVDEASMLAAAQPYEGNNVLEDLLNYVYNGENCHLIFIGDPGQLPPVGQEDSIALHPQKLAEAYSSIEIWHSHLSQVVRVDSSSSILTTATFLRNKKAFDLPLFPHITDGKTSNVRRIHGGEFQDYLEQSMAQVGADETILLTLANKRANQWNLEIRNRLFYREEVLEKGDLLMIVKNNYYWLDPSSKMGFIANGELARIERVRKFEAFYGFEFALLDLRFVDYPEIGSVTCLVHIQSLLEEGANLTRETLKKLFYAIEAEHADIKNKQKRYREVMKNPYFNALQVKYAHAVTVHKAQGGQWAHVYVDYGFLPEERKNQSYLRWLYTALTRASEQLYLLNFPDDFFTT